MKRPQKVTPESRLNQYARKMYGKEKFEKQWDEAYETESLTGKKGDKKKIRTTLNRKLRHSKKQDIADGGAYKPGIAPFRSHARSTPHSCPGHASHDYQ